MVTHIGRSLPAAAACSCVVDELKACILPALPFSSVTYSEWYWSMYKLAGEAFMADAVVGSLYRAGVIARAATATKEKWWEKETPNMRNINGVQELVDALVSAQ